TPFILYNDDNTSTHFAKISTKSKYHPLRILEASHRYPTGFNVIFLSCRNILQQRSRDGERGANRNIELRMEGARESDVVGRTKENSICTGSQPNPTSSKCRKDGSERVKATRSECHPLRNRPCEIRLG
ncbi:hypothetical protein ALC60_01966, partial [Trachymyrmex zeteki]